MPETLDRALREVPDFPKPGICFKDITPLLADPKLLAHSIELLVQTAQGQSIDYVVGLDARGFIFGAPVALALGAGFVPIRKKGKLPWKTYEQSYELEYGTNTIEIHQDAIEPGAKVMIVDDLLATGGTAAAAAALLSKLGADIVSISFLIELDFLNGRAKLPAGRVQSILNY